MVVSVCLFGSDCLLVFVCLFVSIRLSGSVSLSENTGFSLSVWWNANQESRYLSIDNRVAVTPLLIVGESLSPALVTQPRSACKYVNDILVCLVL